MRKVFFFLLLVFLPLSTFAQRVVCDVFTPETVAKMQSHNMQFSEGITEYMTAKELSAVLNRAVQCEAPQPELLKSLDTAIAWRVTKFSQTSEQLSRMLEEYCASYGQESVTSTIAIKWLAHNNFVARFNVWDAADVNHNWDTLKHSEKVEAQPKPSVDDQPKPASPSPSKAIQTKTYMVVGSVDIIQPADKNCQGTDCWWAVIGSHGTGASDGWVVYASPKPNLQVGSTACVKAQFPLGGDAGPLLSNKEMNAHYPRLVSYRTVGPHALRGVYEASGSKDSCVPPTQ